MRQTASFLSMILLTVTLVACKSRKGNAQNPVEPDFKLQIEHTGCRGNCPNFFITVEASGKVTWFGNHAVKRMGTWVKQIPVSRVNEIAKAIDDAGFWNFKEGYGTEVADVPGIVTDVTHRGKHHRVWDIRNAPPELKTLEQKLESLIGDEGYAEQK